MKFEKLDAVRGFAAVYVVIYHLLMPVKLVWYHIDLLLPFRFGQEAVILFFLLSGFVIEYSFQKSKDKTFRNYFFKRFTRIYIPLFFIYILSYLVTIIAAKNIVNPDWLNLLANIFMLQDVHIKPNVIAGTYMGNFPLWSLSYEWWFYMLFYLLYKNVPKKQNKFIVYIIVLVSGMTYIFYPFFLNRILFYFGIWYVGVELAQSYLSNNLQFNKLTSTFFLLLSCVILCSINYVFNNKKYNPSFGTSPMLELRHFGFAFIILVLSLLWKKYRWIGFNSTFNLFEKVAPISYTLYISHYPLLINRGYLIFLKNPYIQLVVALILTISFSSFIELKVYPQVKTYLQNRLPVFAHLDKRRML